MKRSLSLAVVGILVAASHQLFAQGMGGQAPAYSQPGHPIANQPNTNSYPSNTSTSLNANGPKTASVTISDGSHSATTFPTETRQLSASFTTSGTNKGDKLQAIWLSSVNGRKKIYETNMTGDQTNFGGSVSINGPASGWPAGKYELDLFVNNKLVAHQPFKMGK